VSDPGRTSHREATRALLREAVFRAATDLVARAPWGEVSMAAVAASAGVSRQTLYNEFGSRDELAQAYALWTAEEFLDEIERSVADHHHDLRLALEAAFELFLGMAGEHPLVRALEATSGADGVLALVAGPSGVPVVTTATDRLAGIIGATWPAIPADDVALVAEALVRLAISHLTVATHPGPEAAASVGRLLAPYLDRVVAATTAVAADQR
jgi:AcrR family transcriptional regulator